MKFAASLFKMKEFLQNGAALTTAAYYNRYAVNCKDTNAFRKKTKSGCFCLVSIDILQNCV